MAALEGLECLARPEKCRRWKWVGWSSPGAGVWAASMGSPFKSRRPAHEAGSFASVRRGADTKWVSAAFRRSHSPQLEIKQDDIDRWRRRVVIHSPHVERFAAPPLRSN